MKTKLVCILFYTFFLVGKISAFSSVSNYSYLPYFEAGGGRFFNIGIAKAASEANLFIPLWQRFDKLFFTHLRFFDRSGRPFEGNAHVGYRQLMPKKDCMYGIYGAFDRKKSELGNYFNQLTFGLEGWFKSFFIGGNFYQPIGITSRFIGVTGEKPYFDRVQSNVWITSNTQHEKAMRGGDAEVGYEFVKGLTGYVGGYYFRAKDVETILGPKARLAYDWSLKSGKRVLGIFDKFGLEFGIQRDKPRGTTYYVGANIRIGLLPNKNNNLEGVARHMVDLVRRDVDIVSGSASKFSRNIYSAVHEIVGDPSSGLIDEKVLGGVLADSQAKIVSVKGHIPDVGLNLLANAKGEKEIVFKDKLIIKSPATGKIMEVDISHPSGKVGTISVKARRALTGDEGPIAKSENNTRRSTAASDSEENYSRETIIFNPKKLRKLLKISKLKSDGKFQLPVSNEVNETQVVVADDEATRRSSEDIVIVEDEVIEIVDSQDNEPAQLVESQGNKEIKETESQNDLTEDNKRLALVEKSSVEESNEVIDKTDSHNVVTNDESTQQSSEDVVIAEDEAVQQSEPTQLVEPQDVKEVPAEDNKEIKETESQDELTEDNKELALVEESLVKDNEVIEKDDPQDVEEVLAEENKEVKDTEPQSDAELQDIEEVLTEDKTIGQAGFKLSSLTNKVLSALGGLVRMSVPPVPTLVGPGTHKKIGEGVKGIGKVIKVIPGHMGPPVPEIVGSDVVSNVVRSAGPPVPSLVGENGIRVDSKAIGKVASNVADSISKAGELVGGAVGSIASHAGPPVPKFVGDDSNEELVLLTKKAVASAGPPVLSFNWLIKKLFGR